MSREPLRLTQVKKKIRADSFPRPATLIVRGHGILVIRLPLMDLVSLWGAGGRERGKLGR